MNGVVRPTLTELGQIIAEPARLRILQELLGGTALSAGALAARVGIAPSTASAHLARLSSAGLIETEQHGRTRLSRITDPSVAEAIEALLRLSSEPTVASLTGFDRRVALRKARSCYDHIAGELGVGLTDLAMTRGWVTDTTGVWTLHENGREAIEHATGLTLAWPTSVRPAVLACMDWTEWRPHLAGKLGRALFDAMITDGWLRRRREDRSLAITPRGEAQLARIGLEEAHLARA